LLCVVCLKTVKTSITISMLHRVTQKLQRTMPQNMMIMTLLI